VSHVLILGAGNGGLALTADLVRRGVDVALYNRGEAALAAVCAQGGVRYEGVLGEGFAPVSRASTDLSSLVAGAELLVVCTPATAHAFLAQRLAPLLRAGQRVVLNPGGMLGALAFVRALRAAGCREPVHVAETGTLTHICRKVDDGLVRITSVVSDLPFAALPGVLTPAFADEVRYALPTLWPFDHSLAVGFTNVNAVLHPPAMILGAAWIEASNGDFLYYHDTAVPSVARLMEALDAERLAVARAWGVEAEPFLKLFARIGSTSKTAADQGDFRQALLDSAPNRWIKAPPSLDHRYMHEDMPFGAVPLADLGRAAGVPTPAFDAVITLASTVTGRDYHAEGRTLASLGLEGMHRADVLHLLVHTSSV
jgi:opine dehydrogenase